MIQYDFSRVVRHNRKLHRNPVIMSRIFRRVRQLRNWLLRDDESEHPSLQNGFLTCIKMRQRLLNRRNAQKRK